METITSISNPRVQFIKKLKDKSFRRENGLMVVEGWNMVKDLPKSASVHTVVYEEGREEKFSSKISCFPQENHLRVSSKVMESISDTKTPCGILCVIEIPSNEEKLTEDCLVLDGVSDPGNFGTIVRTATACGIRQIYALGCADWTSGKVVRSSMGGVLRATITECDITGLKKSLNGRELLALDMDGESIYSLQRKPGRGFALAVGNEAHGISDALSDMSEKIVSLPMEGDMESLNAAVSISIAMYQLRYGK